MQLLETGYKLIDAFISEHWRQTILQDIQRSIPVSRGGGIRHIDKKLRSVSDYLNSREFLQRSDHFLTRRIEDSQSIPMKNRASLVRAILFNKTANSNWYVTWHQDKTVAVSKQFDAPGWHAWSIKDGVIHVQPPLSVLEEMITIRIHLDPTPKENACLQVIPYSHERGILSPEKIADILKNEAPNFCEANQCTALIMRPHLLHASSKSSVPIERRVLHFEFSHWQLPDGVDWAS